MSRLQQNLSPTPPCCSAVVMMRRHFEGDQTHEQTANNQVGGHRALRLVGARTAAEGVGNVDRIRKGEGRSGLERAEAVDPPPGNDLARDAR